MILKLTNAGGKKFLLNSDIIFEAEEIKDPDNMYKTIIRLINNRECMVKETLNEIYKMSTKNIV